MKAPAIEGMTDNLHKGMTWLSKTFSETLHDAAQDSQDIYQDLWVVFLEKKCQIERKPMKRGFKNRDSLWFIVFKNYLIDRARKLKVEPQLLQQVLDKNPYENNN